MIRTYENIILCVFPIILSFLSCTINPKTPMLQPNGKIIQLDSFPSAYVDARTIFIWLPVDYDASKQYAVIYMHDGQMLFDSTTTWTQQEWKVDETMTRMLKENTIRNAIVVGIPNSGINRWAEYTPQAILEQMPEEVKAAIIRKRLNKNPLADRYLKFIVDELRPYINTHYATLTDPTSTFIMGSSMGGVISLYAICAYPNVFGGAACLSTHWPLDLPGVAEDEIVYDIHAAFLQYLEQNLPSPTQHRIYFDYGTETLDSLYKPYQLKVDSLMLTKGYTSETWMTKEFPGEDHTERAWAERLHIPLGFLLGKK